MKLANDSLLCLGLDPDPDKLPGFPDPYREDARMVGAFCHGVINYTHDIVGAYKINSAFFEHLGAGGFDAMKGLIHHAQSQGVPVILDAKRCDIGNSARFYAKSAYETLKASSMTVLPYFGPQALDVFDWPGKTTFVVAASTNAGAEGIQGEFLATVHQVAKLYPSMGFVAPAPKNSWDTRLADIRQSAPDAWLLIPGVGAQGGNLRLTATDAMLHMGKALIAVSRDILFAEEFKPGMDWHNAVRQRAHDYNEQINKLRNP